MEKNGKGKQYIYFDNNEKLIKKGEYINDELISGVSYILKDKNEKRFNETIITPKNLDKIEAGIING